MAKILPVSKPKKQGQWSLFLMLFAVFSTLIAVAAYAPIIHTKALPNLSLNAGKPQSGVLEAARRSIELTFLVTVVLSVISILPAHLITRNLSYQLR